jgi:hypothetical protein
MKTAWWRRTSLGIVLAGLLLLCVDESTARTPQNPGAPQRKTMAEDEVTKLLRERHDAGEKEFQYLNALAKIGVGSDFGVFVIRYASSGSRVADAILQLPAKPEEKIRLLKDVLAQAEAFENRIQQRLKANIGDSFIHYPVAHCLRLDVQLRLLRLTGRAEDSAKLLAKRHDAYKTLLEDVRAQDRGFGGEFGASLSEYLCAGKRVLDSALEVPAKREEKITILKDFLAQGEPAEKNLERLFQAKKVPLPAYMLFRYVRLDAEIRLLKLTGATDHVAKRLAERHDAVKQEFQYLTRVNKGGSPPHSAFIESYASAGKRTLDSALDLPAKPEEKIEIVEGLLKTIQPLDKIMEARSKIGSGGHSLPDHMVIRYLRCDVEIQLLKLKRAG